MKQTAILEFCRVPFHFLNLSVRTGVSREASVVRSLKTPTIESLCAKKVSWRWTNFPMQTPESHLSRSDLLEIHLVQHTPSPWFVHLQGDHDALEVHLLQVIYQGTGVLLVKPCWDFCDQKKLEVLHNLRFNRLSTMKLIEIWRREEMMPMFIQIWIGWKYIKGRSSKSKGIWGKIQQQRKKSLSIQRCVHFIQNHERRRLEPFLRSRDDKKVPRMISYSKTVIYGCALHAPPH